MSETWPAIGLGTVGVLFGILILYVLIRILKEVTLLKLEIHCGQTPLSGAANVFEVPTLAFDNHILRSRKLEEHEDEHQAISTGTGMGTVDSGGPTSSTNGKSFMNKVRSTMFSGNTNERNMKSSKRTTSGDVTMKKHNSSLYASKSSNNIFLVGTKAKQDSFQKTFLSTHKPRPASLSHLSSHDSENSLYGYLPGH